MPHRHSDEDALTVGVLFPVSCPLFFLQQKKHVDETIL